MKSSKIIGIGTYVPPTIVTNNDLSKLMDTSDEWIQQRTGIKQRHWIDLNTNTTTSDLAIEAAQRAIENAQILKEDLDMIIFATLSPDHEFPGTACFFQAKLGVSGIPALDVRQQCTGFIHGLSIADQFIRTGMYKTILVIGAELQSKGLDITTRGRDVAVLFGDGAGAVVVTATENCKDKARDKNAPHILSTHLHADGKFAKELWVRVPGYDEPGTRLTQEKLAGFEHFPKMNGKTVFVHAVKRMPEVVMEALQANQLAFEEVDLFLFHQANQRINEMVAKQMGIPEEKVFNTIERFGNTTAATIPIGMQEAIRVGKLKPGMLVACSAFGSGFTWASALIRW